MYQVYLSYGVHFGGLRSMITVAQTNICVSQHITSLRYHKRPAVSSRRRRRSKLSLYCKNPGNLYFSPHQLPHLTSSFSSNQSTHPHPHSVSHQNHQKQKPPPPTVSSKHRFLHLLQTIPNEYIQKPEQDRSPPRKNGRRSPDPRPPRTAILRNISEATGRFDVVFLDVSG